MAEPPSSPPGETATAEDALAWYKSQYEQLEGDLAEFRESSRELEQELEKDIERAEKQERMYQEKAETLGFEVEEWKVCVCSVATVGKSADIGFVAKIQGIQDRGSLGPGFARKGDHHAPRLASQESAQAQGYRSRQR